MTVTHEPMYSPPQRVVDRYGDELQVVTFLWSTRNGPCYECGLPAAFSIGAEPRWGLVDGYARRIARDEDKRCSVCAANAAVDGETVWSLNEEPDGPEE